MNQDFEIKDGVLLKYHGSDQDVSIPDGVTSIGQHAFQYCKNLVSVHIPDSVTRIRDFVFWNCISLTSVNIPDGVTCIEEAVFWNCSALTSVKIPDGVIGIGDCAFCRCSGLTSVNIPASVSYIGEDVFLKCTSLKHAPLMLIDGNMLYEPKNRNGVEFSEIKRLVTWNDYSMEMNAAVKYDLIFQMYALGIDQEGHSDYIAEHFSVMFPVLIDRNDTEILRKILHSEIFVTEQNIDSLIRYAIAVQKYQMQLMLTNYKQEKNWYQNPDEILKL